MTAADVDLEPGDQIQDHQGNWRTVVQVFNSKRAGRVGILDSAGLVTFEWAVELSGDAFTDVA